MSREISEDDMEDYRLEEMEMRAKRRLWRSHCPDCRMTGGSHNANCPNDNGPRDEEGEE